MPLRQNNFSENEDVKEQARPLPQLTCGFYSRALDVQNSVSDNLPQGPSLGRTGSKQEKSSRHHEQIIRPLSMDLKLSSD